MIKKFDIKKSCDKCGYRGRRVDDVVLRPAATAQYVEPPPGQTRSECILRVCKRCGYKWREACVDG